MILGVTNTMCHVLVQNDLIGASSDLTFPPITACLSGAAKLARRQRGEKICSPRQRGRKLEHRAARSQRGEGAVVVFVHFFLLFLYNTYVY